MSFTATRIQRSAEMPGRRLPQPPSVYPWLLETTQNGKTVHAQVVALGFDIDGTPQHDAQVLTYVAAGNGAGEVETITYKVGGQSGTTVGTRTLTYDASDRVETNSIAYP